MRRYGFTMAVAITVTAIGVTAGADAPAFVFTSIDVPGAVATGAFGINARGEVVGFYRDASNRQHGFVLGRDGLQSLDFPGAALTDARGISPDGEVVGTYRNAGEPAVHGYRFTRAGEYVPVDYPGHTNTIAQRIGPDGTIYGCYHDQDIMDSMHGIAIRGDELAEVEMPTTMSNGATPDGRTIVGFYTDMEASPPRSRGYLVRDGEFIPFDVPGSRGTAGWDINPGREVVGVYQDANGRTHGYLMDALGNVTTLDFPGAVITRAFGINARGDVVGNYVDASNRTHGFLARRIGAEP